MADHMLLAMAAQALRWPKEKWRDGWPDALSIEDIARLEATDPEGKRNSVRERAVRETLKQAAEQGTLEVAEIKPVLVQRTYDNPKIHDSPRTPPQGWEAFLAEHEVDTPFDWKGWWDPPTEDDTWIRELQRYPNGRPRAWEIKTRGDRFKYRGEPVSVTRSMYRTYLDRAGQQPLRPYTAAWLGEKRTADATESRHVQHRRDKLKALLQEIELRAQEQGVPYERAQTPGDKKQFREFVRRRNEQLAYQLPTDNDRLDDDLKPLGVKFLPGNQKNKGTEFFQRLFPELC